jgi:hypothetical protein
MKVLAHVIARPAIGRYTPDVLRLEERELPSAGEGEVRVRLIYLSLDPTNRNWLKLESVSTIVEKVGRNLAVGDVMIGQVLGIVEESRAAGFEAGDRVAALGQWQEQMILPASRLRKLHLADGEPLSMHLTIFSHVGFAAMVGLTDIARIQPGQTVLISGAAGATGSLAVGIAKDRGCHVVGIAGGAEKCQRVKAEFGADAAIDYKTQDLGKALQNMAPNGIHAFFDNVGGAILDEALMHMVPGGCVAVCGVMADYDAAGNARGIQNMYQVLVRHLRIEGFLAGHFADRQDAYFNELRRLLSIGRIKHRPHIVEGFSRANEYLAMLFAGTNQGKLLVEA